MPQARDTLAHELLVSVEALGRGGRGLLGTVKHQATRGVAWTRQIADTSRQGKFRNGRFRAIAEELGLEVTAAHGNG